MNNKGQMVFLSIMIAIVFLIAIISMIPITTTQVSSAMSNTSMDCNNASISTENKVVCSVMDVGFIFYFISVCLAVAISYVAGKKTLTGILTSIMCFIVTVLLITPLKYWIILARDADHLNCAAATISLGGDMLCIFIDLWLFYFVVTCIAAGITYVVATKVIPEK